MSDSCHIPSVKIVVEFGTFVFFQSSTEKKLRPNFAFWDTFKLTRCLNSKEIKLNKCDFYSFRSAFCSAENLKENKDSKFQRGKYDMNNTVVLETTLCWCNRHLGMQRQQKNMDKSTRSMTTTRMIAKVVGSISRKE